MISSDFVTGWALGWLFLVIASIPVLIADARRRLRETREAERYLASLERHRPRLHVEADTVDLTDYRRRRGGGA